MTGNLVIAGNVIERVHALSGYGVLVSGHDAETTIGGNTINGINLHGILVGSNSKPVSIVSNLVVPGAAQDWDVSLGNGILFGHPRGGTAYIAHNKVICENAFADGILFLGNGPRSADNSIVEKNKVTMHGSLYGGISMYDTSSHNVVRHNKIEGSGAAALQVARYIGIPGEVAVGNAFVDNDVRHFTATLADVFLDINSVDTLLVDQDGSLIDIGTGTQVHFKHGRPGHSQDVK